MLKELSEIGFNVECHSHAEAILVVDFFGALEELVEVVKQIQIPIDEIVGSGGGETQGTQRLRRALSARNWVKTAFTIEKKINGVTRESISHEIDHVRTTPNGVIALEIEWNNKDPFYDRDLENFKRLHAEGAVSVGVIVTRGASLQASMRDLVRRYAREKKIGSVDDLHEIGLNPTARQIADYGRRVMNGSEFSDAWANSFVADKYGAATTHWAKLEARVHRGVGNPCPLVLIGIPDSAVVF